MGGRIEFAFNRDCLKGTRTAFKIPGVWVEDNPPGIAIFLQW
jgi:hypothetical protein